MAATTKRASTMPLSETTPSSAPACAIPPPGERSQEFSNNNVKVSQKAPTSKDIERVSDIPVLDAEGKSRPFKNIYEDEEYDRVLLLFVRHFFCGNCQEYLRTLTETLPPSALPPRTTIRIIGHGQPELIPFYASMTGTPYAIYADPSKRLYAELGMGRTLNMGHKQPEYIHKSVLGMMWSSMVANLGQGRKMFMGGDYWQVGGEMLFERREGGRVEVGFCHRMENTRDHAEVPELVKVLGVGQAAQGAAEEKEVKEEGAKARGSESSEDEVARAKREAGRSAVKKRWTLTGENMRRSLSVRRDGWSRSRSRGGEARLTAVA